KPYIRSPTGIEMSLPKNPFAKGPTSGRVGQLDEASGHNPRTNIPVASAPGRTEDSRCAQVWLGAGLDSAVRSHDELKARRLRHATYGVTVHRGRWVGGPPRWGRSRSGEEA